VKLNALHSWDLNPTEAAALQRELAGRVDTRTPLVGCELVAGADVSHAKHSNAIWAGVVVLRMDDLSVVEQQGVAGRTTFPYIPGLLSFRETPAVLEAFAKLKTVPDAVLIDGQGLAHPRRFGYACHVGLWLDRPTVGCAKSRLLGKFKEPGEKAGSVAPLVDKDEVIGEVVRTRNRVNPIFVSVGHKIDLRSAAELCLTTCRGYRIPEPTRQAHLYVNALRRGDA
jgi:deoxyribonuclease V